MGRQRRNRHERSQGTEDAREYRTRADAGERPGYDLDYARLRDGYGRWRSEPAGAPDSPGARRRAR